MLYTKTKLNEEITLSVPLYNDEIYTQCPGCGAEHAVEPEILAHILNEGECFESASVYCEKCSKKETANEAATAIREIVEGLKLHISKIGEYDNETVKEALNEDLRQLQTLFR